MKHNLVKKVAERKRKRAATEGGSGAAVTTTTGTYIHHSILEEVSPTPTIVKRIEYIYVKQGVFTRKHLK